MPSTTALQIYKADAISEVHVCCGYTRGGYYGPYITEHYSSAVTASGATSITDEENVSSGGFIDVDYISVKNASATTASVMFQIEYNTLVRELTAAITLLPEELLIINDNGIFVYTSTGAIKSGSSGKCLGQSAPNATTETDLYTVPASKTAKVTSLFVTNRSAVAVTYRLSVSVGGGATANKDYLYYDTAIQPNSTIMVDMPAIISATDKIRVYASTANLSFNLFGEEY